jgi:hypothetical protein
MNLGYGLGQYQETNSVANWSSGIFASVGVDLSSQVGFSLGWAGGLGQLTSSISYIPFSNLPITINVGASNITQLDDRSLVPFLSIGYGLR